MTDAKRLSRDWRRRPRRRLSLLLDNVSQPFNVGSMLRTAAAFSVDQVWLCGSTAAPGHPAARKTALGTDRLITVTRAATAAEAARAAAADGYRVVAIELASGAVPLHEAPLAGDICVAVGNEDHGCSAALLAAADVVVYIPLPGKVGSLNVAAATAIALAEVRRRDWTGGTGS